MKKAKPRKAYNSLKYKTFRTAFIQMLESDFSILGSGKVLDLIADETIQLFREFYPDKISPGETVVSAISVNAPKGHHRGVRDLPMVPVKLPVIDEKIINRYIEGDNIRQIKKEYVISLFKEAYRQGGVFSCSDVALLIKMSSATISKYVRDYMSENEEIVPTRGFVHDIGPSISHKGIIVGKFLKGILPDQIAKQTNHSLNAVDRYIKDYERIKLCIKQNMDDPMISRTTTLSKSLIKKYRDLYQTYEGDYVEN